MDGDAGVKTAVKPAGGLARALFVAAALSAVWVLVNSGKPLHIDDPFHMYWARVISPLPGDKPMHYVDWDRFEEPLVHQTKNYSPGWAILLAGARHAVGERESALHWLMWPFAAMFLAGIFIIARAMGAPAWGTMLVCAASPVFLVPSSGLMGDIPAMGLGILGLAVWIARPTLAGRILAVLLLGAAGQMKQSALVLYPLLIFDAGGRITRKPLDWVLAVLALVLGATYPDVAPHNADPSSFAGTVASILRSTWYPVILQMKLSYLLAAFGSLFLPVFAYALLAAFRRDLQGFSGRAKMLALGALAIPVMSVLGFWKSHPSAIKAWIGDNGAGARFSAVPGTMNTLWFYLVIALFIAWVVYTYRPRKDGAPVWLHLWLMFASAGFLLATWFPAVRHSIPALPPLVMIFLTGLYRLCGRDAARAVVFVAGAGNLWLGLSLARNDHVFARFCVDAADRGMKEAVARDLPLVTTASWGLRYYVEQRGGRILAKSTEQLPQGAVMLCPRLTDRRILPAALRKRSRMLWAKTLPPSREFPLILPVQTIPPVQTLGAFHGGYVWFPYAFTRSPSEEVTAFLISPQKAGR